MCGSRLWEHRGLAALQGGIAIAGFGTVVLLGSIGGQLGRGESALRSLTIQVSYGCGTSNRARTIDWFAFTLDGYLCCLTQID